MILAVFFACVWIADKHAVFFFFLSPGVGAGVVIRAGRKVTALEPSKLCFWKLLTSLVCWYAHIRNIDIPCCELRGDTQRYE